MKLEQSTTTGCVSEFVNELQKWKCFGESYHAYPLEINTQTFYTL